MFPPRSSRHRPDREVRSSDVTSVETEPGGPAPQMTATAVDDVTAPGEDAADATEPTAPVAPTFGRDRVLAFIAVFLLAMSSFPLFAWVTGTADVFPRAPDLLDATRLPATFPFVDAATDRDGTAPAMAWVPISLVVATLVVSAFRPMVRRIGYLVLGAAAITVTVFFALALGEALAQAGNSDLWIAHIGPGSGAFAVAGALLVVAALLVPRRGRTRALDADAPVTATEPTLDAPAGSVVAVPGDTHAAFAPPQDTTELSAEDRGAHDHPEPRPVLDTGDAPGRRSHPPESPGHSD